MHPESRSLTDRLILLLATGFYSGLSPKAPGTMGSLVGVALYYPLSFLSLPLYLLATGVITLAGVPISGRAEKLYGRKDCQKIVIDEVAGVLIALIAAPPGAVWVAAGFLLFRLFDIWKPFKALERLKGGLGVMADDIAAGLAALAVLQLIHRYLG